MGPHSVKTGQTVYVNDSDLLLSPVDGSSSVLSQGLEKRRIGEVVLRLFLETVDYAQTGMSDVLTEVLVLAFTAMFGGDPASTDLPQGPIAFGHGAGVGLVRDKTNVYGCSPYKRRFQGEAIVVHRGECTFAEKLMEAAVAGASGVITLTDDENAVNPSIGLEQQEEMGTSLDDVAIVTTSRTESALVTAMLDSAELYGNEVRMAIAPGAEFAADTHQLESDVNSDERRTKAKEGNRVLYLNGHPLLNTRLMV